MLSIPHMIVVFIVVLVVFGPQKLPELARGLGKLMAEFRKASTDFKSAFEEEMREMERQAMQAERKKAAEAAAATAAATESASNQAPALSAGAEEAPVEDSLESHATEELVVTPVAEAIPHTAEEQAEPIKEGTPVNSSEAALDEHRHPA